MLQMHLCSAVGRYSLAKVGNQAKPEKYSEKGCILYQFRADVQTYSL